MKCSWAQRLSPPVRVGVTLLLILAVVVMAGMMLGFTMAAVEKGGQHKLLFYLILAAMVGVGALIVWALVVVIRSWWSPDVSPYDRRYIRMWAILGACGVPIGFGLVLVSDHENQGSLAMFGNSPIDPGLAIALAIGTAVLFAASAIIYHRTVDDHEERAYLWGSTIAYYFILTAFPVAWLLARGGLIEKLGIGSAIAILMMSLVVQTAVWLRFKFR